MTSATPKHDTDGPQLTQQHARPPPYATAEALYKATSRDAEIFTVALLLPDIRRKVEKVLGEKLSDDRCRMMAKQAQAEALYWYKYTLDLERGECNEPLGLAHPAPDCPGLDPPLSLIRRPAFLKSSKAPRWQDRVRGAVPRAHDAALNRRCRTGSRASQRRPRSAGHPGRLARSPRASPRAIE
jgi:hypothetical protein